MSLLGRIRITQEIGIGFQKVILALWGINNHNSGEWPVAIVPATYNVYVAPTKLDIENLPIFRGNVEEEMWGDSGDENDDDMEYKGDDSDAEVVLKKSITKAQTKKKAVTIAKKEEKPPTTKSQVTTNTRRDRRKSSTSSTMKKKSRASPKPYTEWRVLHTQPELDESGRRKHILHFKLFSLT